MTQETGDSTRLHINADKIEQNAKACLCFRVNQKHRKSSAPDFISCIAKTSRETWIASAA